MGRVNLEGKRVLAERIPELGCQFGNPLMKTF